MIAGRMKYRLLLFEPRKSVNAFGEESLEYTPVRTIHAERVKHTARRSEEVGEHFPDFTAEYNIRTAHPVRENWRVEQVGEHLYTVTNVLENRDKGYLTLLCERVNE